ATPIVTVALLIAYVALVRVSAKYAAEGGMEIDAELTEVPDPGPTIKSGLHFLLPIVVLVWCLTVERFSPGLSAFWATVFMIFILITQRPLMTLMNKSND
ncbi:C4-dicarboxylate ABC transporter, partial [Vibrio sp. 10N.222.54.F6]